MRISRILAALAFVCSNAAAQSPATLIVNAKVIDGTGAAARAAEVRIVNGRIDAIGPATDQFALAAILYEMLSGEIAFFEPTVSAVLDAVINRDPPPLPGAELAAVDSVLRAGLAKEKGDRFPDILAFARAIRAAAR